jgi:type 1 fimbria pilin
MPTTFQRNKTNLIIATLATGLGVHLASMAQLVADQGSLNITGQISASTCLLDMGDAGSTGGGSKTMNLGTYTAAVAGAATASGGTFGTAQTVLFSVKSADGSGANCTLGGSGKWDIGINVGSTGFTTVGGNTLLLSGGTASNVAGNMGVLLKTSMGSAVTAGATNLNLSAGSATYGVLLSSSSASAPQAAATDKIALTAQFARTNATAPTTGAFSATIPLNVYYK